MPSWEMLSRSSKKNIEKQKPKLQRLLNTVEAPARSPSTIAVAGISGSRSLQASTGTVTTRTTSAQCIFLHRTRHGGRIRSAPTRTTCASGVSTRSRRRTGCASPATTSWTGSWRGRSAAHKTANFTVARKMELCGSSLVRTLRLVRGVINTKGAASLGISLWNQASAGKGCLELFLQVGEKFDADLCFWIYRETIRKRTTLD